ncbi:MAG TPA: hypothetical protein VGK99_14080 [Acidobacteriota bacterium]|jgi:hypothetical protein|nr:hypothetical protein [Blastocatellia bacterium]
MDTIRPANREVVSLDACGAGSMYITTGTIWLVSNLDSAMVLRLQPSEPYLTIMETLMLLMNPALVTQVFLSGGA